MLGLDPSHGAESLQLVQEGDDEAGSDVHDPGEFSLGTALGSSEQREQAYVLGLELQIPDGRDEPPGELGSQQGQAERGRTAERRSQRVILHERRGANGVNPSCTVPLRSPSARRHTEPASRDTRRAPTHRARAMLRQCR